MAIHPYMKLGMLPAKHSHDLVKGLLMNNELPDETGSI
jgi:hypothetical protein